MSSSLNSDKLGCLKSILLVLTFIKDVQIRKKAFIYTVGSEYLK